MLAAMRRFLALLVLALLVLAAPAGARVKQGPAGARFYAPPAKLVRGAHGTLVWARRASVPASLKYTSGNELLLYRSRSVSGKSVVVSGTLSLPRGKAPGGGWPVITYDHGTTGIADQCAPSRVTSSGITSAYSSYVYPLLQMWLRHGWAVVRTDYEGLGTPGVHPYLIGRSEARSTLDIVRAARRYSSKLSRRIVISGHSQGGHAALFATDVAPSWTPELKVRGTVAFAPASHLATQGKIIPTLGSSAAGLSGLVSLIIRGVDSTYPSLHEQRILSARGASLYPQTLTRCLPQLGQKDSFGGVAPKDIFRSGADFGPTINALSKNDPEHLNFGTQVLVEQGLADSTVFPQFTDDLVAQYRERGIGTIYHTYKGVTHGGVVVAAAPDATRYIARRFR